MPRKHITKGLNQLIQNLEEMNGRSQVTLPELLNEEFLSSCSQFIDVDEMITASNITMASAEDFLCQEWNNFVVANTTFAAWEDMFDAAMREYLRKRAFKDS